MNRRSLIHLGLAWVALAAAGCGGGTTRHAFVSRSVTPASVVAVPATDGREFAATFTVTLTESGGVGANINAVTATVYETVGGLATASLGTDSSTVAIAAAGNRLEANGTLPIAFAVSYTTPNAVRTALVRVAISYTDDEGELFSGTIDVPIA